MYSSFDGLCSIRTQDHIGVEFVMDNACTNNRLLKKDVTEVYAQFVYWL